MKNKLLYSCLVAASVFVAGCTKDFQEINTNPNKVTADVYNPNFLLAQAQIQYSQTGYDQLLFQSMWSQSLASPYDYYSNGDKYVASASFNDYKGRVYNSGYNASTLVDEMRILTTDKPAYSNLNAIGLIMRVFILQRVTDAYGDVPYTEAGQAKNGIFTPKFDTQQAVYTAMLSDLDAAIAALDPAKDKPTSDLMYAGDIAKWKRFANSLMVRVAMRLTKVDAGTARTYTEKAYARGTLSDYTENALVKADVNGNSNSTTNALTVPGDFREVRWSAPLITFMKSTLDPRVSAVAEVPVGDGAAANADQAAVGDNTFAQQIGLPNGYDLNGGATDVSKEPHYPGATPASGAGDSPAPLGNYSRLRGTVYLNQSGINMLLTYGETELLLAEAASRGWATGTAATHYANALKADMKSLSQFSEAAAIADADITAYVAAHPLVPATALQQINMEYWVETSTVLEFNETWANWRRSGFPVLTPITYPGQYVSGGIPRRIPYPLGLSSTNPTNLNEAIGRLTGGDTFSARVWWDK
jgi:hypothetical protein